MKKFIVYVHVSYTKGYEVEANTKEESENLLDEDKNKKVYDKVHNYDITNVIEIN